jgi:hypothetical protein
MVDDQHAPPAPPGLDGAHHAGGPGPDDQDVKTLAHAS